MRRLAFIGVLLVLVVLGQTLLSQTPLPLSGKKVVLIIAEKNFRDEELRISSQILSSRGAKVTIASTTLKPVRGMRGAVVRPDILLKEVKVENYDAVIFVGGSGARQYWDSPLAHKIARQAVKEKKVLGAICIAPVILARSGVLKGKRATVWWSPSFNCREMIKREGAVWVDRAVVVEGKIITANGPKASQAFAEAIVRVLLSP